MYQRALAIKERIFGSAHPDVALTVYNLAVFYSDQQRYAEAEALFQQALAIFDRTLEPSHPTVTACLTHYAALLRTLQRCSEAQAVEARVYAPHAVT